MSCVEQSFVQPSQFYEHRRKLHFICDDCRFEANNSALDFFIFLHYRPKNGKELVQMIKTQTIYLTRITHLRIWFYLPNLLQCVKKIQFYEFIHQLLLFPLPICLSYASLCVFVCGNNFYLFINGHFFRLNKRQKWNQYFDPNCWSAIYCLRQHFFFPKPK